MTELLVLLSGLGALALAALYWALSPGSVVAGAAADSGDNAAGKVDGAASNAAVFRQRLVELELERERGTLDDATFKQLETELKRQLLAETEGARPEQSDQGSRVPMVVLASVLFAAAVLTAMLYRQIGAWPDLRFHNLQQEFAGKERFDEQDMGALAEAIDTSLKFRPDNGDLRFWRAQLAVEQGDLDVAIEHYRHLLEAQRNNAMVMAQLAQAMFLQSGRKLNDEARALMHRAVEIDPTQTTALGMLGIDAFDRGDFNAAINHWSLLLRHLPPQAPQAEVIGHALARAKEMAAGEGKVTGIRVVVNKGGLALPNEGILYVFAKAAEGPGFPLAVVRVPQNGEMTWPQEFLLTPQDAMRADMTLDQFESVKLTARFSRSGSVSAASGDLEGSSAALNWRSLDGPVELVLDARIP